MEHIPGLYICVFSIYFSRPMKVSTNVWTRGTHSSTIYMLHIFQTSNEGFYHCLDTWNTFLDYICILHIFQPSNEGFHQCLDTWNTFLDYIYAPYISAVQWRFLPLFGHMEHIPWLPSYKAQWEICRHVSTGWKVHIPCIRNLLKLFNSMSKQIYFAANLLSSPLK